MGGLNGKELTAAVAVDFDDNYTDLSTRLLDICRNLIVWDQLSNEFVFAHLSVREYLKDQEALSESESKSTILGRCVYPYLRRTNGLPVDDIVEAKFRDLSSWTKRNLRLYFMKLDIKILDPMTQELLRSFFFANPQALELYLKENNVLEYVDYRFRQFGKSPYLIKAADNINEFPSILISMACELDMLIILKELVVHGSLIPNWDQKDAYGYSPLHVAARHDYVDIAHFLIDHGADIESRDRNECTPLHVATVYSSSRVLNLLICYGAGALDARNGSGYTAMHLAVRSNHLEIIDTLYQHHASLSPQDEEGQTPLHHAVTRTPLMRRGYPIAHKLISLGSDVNVRDKDRRTPLHLLIIQARDNSATTSILDKLLNAHVDIDSQDLMGNTPLHYAVLNLLVKLAIDLLARGANKFITNKEGYIPAEMLGKKRQTESIFTYQKEVYTTLSELLGLKFDDGDLRWNAIIQ